MPKKVQTEEEREKMLQRLAEGRKKIQENREKKQKEFMELGIEDTPAKVFEKREVKPPASKPIPIPKKNTFKTNPEDKLEKIASQLEELTSYKREKIELKKKKEEDDIRLKKEKEEQDLKNKLIRLEELERKEKTKSVPSAPQVSQVSQPAQNEIIFPRSYNHRFLQGGRF